MTLEEQLREAAAAGMTHFTLYPTPSEDGKTIYWRASATPSTVHKHVSTTSLDPVEAAIEVLKAMPKARRREEKITVTVTEPEPELAPAGLHPELEQEIDRWLPRT